VIVPPGGHEVVVRFRSRHFALGAMLSALGLALAATLAWRRRRRET
jgi:hypothetical protein